MASEVDLTRGGIFGALNKFALPVLLTLILQALYGGVDLWVVGRFSSTAEISGVASGSLMMVLLTDMVASLAMGITTVIGQLVGAGRRREAGQSVGAAILLFGLIALAIMSLLMIVPGQLATLLKSPEEAWLPTKRYLFVCGSGMAFIVAYNLLAAIFRGLGDSRTPLLAVAVACVINIAGDLLLVGHFGLGACGAALATVLSQAFSVVISLWIIYRRKDWLEIHLKDICLNGRALEILKLGGALALQDVTVSISFLAIQVVGNSIDVSSSAAVGIGEKLCLFLMLVPIAYMQAMTVFVAQNYGAGRHDRSRRALYCGMGVSFAFGAVMSAVIYYRTDWLSGIFTTDANVIKAARGYLYTYALDCLMTPFLFCFHGFFTGRGSTLFVMIQGIIGAFCVRIPVACIARSLGSTSLFTISLGSPLSSFSQVVMCIFFMWWLRRHGRKTCLPEMPA